jgi:hypothetical protein
MMVGAVAFFIYAALTSWVLWRYRVKARIAAVALIPVWFAISLGSWALVVGIRR